MHKHKVGIDEVGTGAWSGPVYVVGVYAPDTWTYPGLADSKELKKPVIYELAAELTKAISFFTAVISVEDLDEFGLPLVLRRAYKAVALHFREADADCLVEIDGVRVPAGVRNCRAVKRGDSTIPHIMAAAIIAKAARDQFMHEQAKLYPNYGWDTNVGYGTLLHEEGLNRYGLSPLHRTSFKPVRRFLREPARPEGARPVSKDLYAYWRTGDPSKLYDA